MYVFISFSLYVCMCVRMYAYSHTCMHIYMYLRVYVWVDVLFYYFILLMNTNMLSKTRLTYPSTKFNGYHSKALPFLLLCYNEKETLSAYKPLNPVVICFCKYITRKYISAKQIKILNYTYPYVRNIQDNFCWHKMLVKPSTPSICQTIFNSYYP